MKRMDKFMWNLSEREVEWKDFVGIFFQNYVDEYLLFFGSRQILTGIHLRMKFEFILRLIVRVVAPIVSIVV